MENLKSKAQGSYEYVKDQASETYENVKDRAGAAYDSLTGGRTEESMRTRANAALEDDIKPALGLRDTEAPIEPLGQDPEIDNLATADAIQRVVEEESSIPARAMNGLEDAGTTLEKGYHATME